MCKWIKLDLQSYSQLFSGGGRLHCKYSEFARIAVPAVLFVSPQLGTSSHSKAFVLLTSHQTWRERRGFCIKTGTSMYPCIYCKYQTAAQKHSSSKIIEQISVISADISAHVGGLKLGSGDQSTEI